MHMTDSGPSLGYKQKKQNVSCVALMIFQLDWCTRLLKYDRQVRVSSTLYAVFGCLAF